MKYSFKRTKVYNHKHHLRGGKSHKKGCSIRDVCEKYKLYVYLNYIDHNEVEKNKKAFFKIVCKDLGMDFYKIYRTLGKSVKQWNENEISYMDKVKEHMEGWYEMYT